uniref:hypothetical protein n=1 Tax=Hypnea nidulans TaxID=673449 RepID=UPI0027DA2C08|nr:hypothetical protein REP55_pgp009 [Hypnea nidulans]WCH54627.1 hypothetical protein [Hypnea nidulans]
MINKLIYVNKSLTTLILSIKTFDIYFLDTLKKKLNKYQDKNQIIQFNTSYNYKYIVNLYQIYNYLCLKESQYIALIILKKYCSNSESNINSKYKIRFQYLYNQYLIYNKYRQNHKKNNMSDIKIAIIYLYILNQIQDSRGFYKLIQYFLII